ncbi:MAG TPA: SHOCT domain-containing protein [Acidimicrobiales bacterium]|jgi:signal transduction histidine kinase|nr:SHOCT domain-containing protein [Acidimicrobiales bacterium]
MLASSYPLLDIFWSMLEFFAFFVWIYLIFLIFADIFRSHDMGGLTKALWVIVIIVLPLFGALIYLIIRGGGMHERAALQVKRQQEAFNSYVRETAGAGGTSQADEIAKLADLRDKGAITEEEFQAGKARILGS